MAEADMRFSRPSSMTRLRVTQETSLRVLSLRASRKGQPDVAGFLRTLGLQRAGGRRSRSAGDATQCCAWVEPRAWAGH